MASRRRSSRIAALSPEDKWSARVPTKNARTKTAKSNVTRRGRNGSAVTNAKGRSKKKMARKLVVSSQIRERQESPANLPTRGAFSLFPKLPVELQYMIWFFASLQPSPRVLRIAPDPGSQYKTTKVRNTASNLTALDGPRMELLPGQPISIFSLFSVCRDARTAALKEYTTWEKSNPKPFSRIRKTVFVNKAYDVFYFDNYYTRYWFLDLLCHNRFASPTEQVLQREQSALHYYIDQFSGIRNLAMDWPQWIHLMMYSRNRLEWLRHIPSLRVLTIVIDIQNFPHWMRVGQPGKQLQFGPVTPNTVRAESGKIIVWFWQKYLDKLLLKYPEYVIPDVEVVSHYYAKDDCSSEADRRFRVHLDTLKGAAQSEFGESW